MWSPRMRAPARLPTRIAAALFLAGCCVASTRAHAQLSMYTAVDLARRNSTAVHQAQAEVARADAALAETRDVYVPSLIVGSSAGYSYGFPVGQPTLFNAQAQSLVLSFSQPDYIRAARASLRAATLRLTDALDQVELDTALDYIQLNTVVQQLSALAEQKSYSERLQSIEQQREDAGLESQIAATRAEIVAAQADLRRLDLQSLAILLRERIGSLTGLYPKSIQPEATSIPAAAPVAAPAARQTLASVEAGISNAVSKQYLAHGDARQNYRPQVGFGVNYQLFDTNVNNYNYYYLHKLQANNFSVGVQISLPVVDATRRARARGSAADALHANLEAEQARETAEEQTVQLDSTLPTLEAQARLANLQWQLAQRQLQAVLLQLASPPTGAAALSPADEMEARISERARFADVLDARFAVLKSQLSLLRARRQLSQWINTSAR